MPPPADGDGSEDFPPSQEEMRGQLGEPRRNILTLLFAADSHAMNTSELRKRSDIPSGSMRHHTDLLENWELIEEVDRAYTGRGAKAIVWQLTEGGEDFCSEGLDISASSLVRPDDLDDLHDEVEELRGEVDTIKKVMVKIAVEAGGVREETAQEWLEE